MVAIDFSTTNGERDLRTSALCEAAAAGTLYHVESLLDRGFDPNWPESVSVFATCYMRFMNGVICPEPADFVGIVWYFWRRSDEYLFSMHFVMSTTG